MLGLRLKCSWAASPAGGDSREIRGRFGLIIDQSPTEAAAPTRRDVPLEVLQWHSVPGSLRGSGPAPL